MERDLHIDGLKFIMIFLVVLGHLSYEDYGLEINKMVYSFHMPIFVLLSGYFTSIDKLRTAQSKWIKKTFIIYVFAQLGHVLISPLMNESINRNVLISPYLALWYLICLLYWRIAYWRLFYQWNDLNLFILSFFLAIISGFIPIDHIFSFQRAFAFFPFFVMGICMKKRNLISYLEKIPSKYAFIGLVIGLGIAHFFPWVYMPKNHYVYTPEPIIRGIQTIIGIYLCIFILSVSRNKYLEKLACFGQYTLWIYIGHTYLIRIGNYLLYKYNYTLNPIQAVLLTIAYCGLFIWIAQKYTFFKKKAS